MTLLTGNKVRFGNTTFDSINAFKKHIEQEKPIIGGDSGKTPHGPCNSIFTSVVHAIAAAKDSFFYAEALYSFQWGFM